MTIGHILIAVAPGCIAWKTVAGILICNELATRGVKVNYLFTKALIPFYAYRYKKLTEQETGRARFGRGRDCRKILLASLGFGGTVSRVRATVVGGLAS